MISQPISILLILRATIFDWQVHIRMRTSIHARPIGLRIYAADGIAASAAQAIALGLLLRDPIGIHIARPIS